MRESTKRQRLSSISLSSSSPSRIFVHPQNDLIPTHAPYLNRIQPPTFSYSPEWGEDQDSRHSDSIVSFSSPSQRKVTSSNGASDQISSSSSPVRAEEVDLATSLRPFFPVLSSTPKASTADFLSSPMSARYSSSSVIRLDQPSDIARHTSTSFTDENTTSSMADGVVSSAARHSDCSIMRGTTSPTTIKTIADTEPPFGDLFEYPDPWSRIGDILGIGTTAMPGNGTQFPILDQTNKQKKDTSMWLVSMGDKEKKEDIPDNLRSVATDDIHADFVMTNLDAYNEDRTKDTNEGSSFLQAIEDSISEMAEHCNRDQYMAGCGEDSSDHIEDWDEENVRYNEGGAVDSRKSVESDVDNNKPVPDHGPTSIYNSGCYKHILIILADIPVKSKYESSDLELNPYGVESICRQYFSYIDLR
ncbi:hypothetical protein BDQ17DRAFT_221886 [Cyathus striatus]|nr:hypothetical protein BDQ17DRAFT_221886 [Cyathus striatus]